MDAELTITETRDLLRADAAALADAERTLTKAARDHDFARSRNDLGDDAGGVIRRGLVASAEPALAAAEQAAGRAAVTSERNARSALARLSDRPTLDPAGQVDAAARLPLFERDAAKLPLPKLVGEVRSAFDADDRPALWLWLRLVDERLAAPPAPGGERPADAAARAQLSQLLGRAAEVLRDRSGDGVRAEVDSILERSQKLRATVRARQRDRAPLVAADGSRLVAIPR